MRGTPILQRAAKLRTFLANAADPCAKWATVVALAAGGVWAGYRFFLGGAEDWAIDLSLSTQIVRYRDGLDLLMIRVESKNPRDNEVRLDAARDAFVIKVHRLPADMAADAVVDPERDGDLLATVDLVSPRFGYVIPPHADFDDATCVVLPAGARVAVTAELHYQGDYVSTSRVVGGDNPSPD